MGHAGEVVAHALNDLEAEFLVRHLAAAELELNFHLVPLVEEILGMADFREVVVRVDVYAEFDFLHLANRMLFVLLLLGEVVAELAEIDDTADGRLGVRRDLHEVEPHRAGAADGLVEPHDADLFARGGNDDTHLPGADAFVDADVADVNNGEIPLLDAGAARTRLKTRCSASNETRFHREGGLEKHHAHHAANAALSARGNLRSARCREGRVGMSKRLGQISGRKVRRRAVR